MSDIAQRKTDHLDLAARADVGFKRTTTLFECVRLVHDALPELDFEALDTGVQLFGKRLRAPLVIAAMTGGTERAGNINRELASIAEEKGYAFGLGSQRAMHKRAEAAPTYRVRDVAPSALVLGNVGIVQAGAMSSDELAALCSAVSADALCIHLNPAMELVQADGDRDFRAGEATLSRLIGDLPVPVLVKETGCGLSAGVTRRLYGLGIRHVDVSGAGGTSWVAVETHRATPERRRLGETFWEWGIPTAASVALAARQPFETIVATGGVATGLDVAKAIALGATVAGIARPVLRALEEGGRQAALQLLEQVELELKMAMLLVGARDLAALRRAPRMVSGELAAWIDISA